MPIKTCYSTSTEVSIHDPFCTRGFLVVWKTCRKKTSRFQTATSRKFVDPGNNLNLQDSPQTPNFELFFGFCKLHRLKNTRPAIQNETNILFLTHTQFFGLEDFCCAYFHSIHGNNFTFSNVNFYPDCKWSIGYIGQDSPKGDLDPSNQQPAGSH